MDLAVVGGGIAGAYVALRVLNERPEWSIAVFERSARIGGRLLSVRLPPAEATPAELGGMRFRTSQPLISALIGSLGLETRAFLSVHDDNRYLLRGMRWRAGDPNGAGAYRLQESEEGLSAGELLVAAFERVVPGAGQLTDEEWLTVKRGYWFGGRPLRDWRMADVLAAVLSEEGYQYVVDAFGYATLFGDRNAADAIPWVLIETRPEHENRTLVDGMEHLPREVAARFAAAGGKVRLEHELVRVDVDPRGEHSKLYRLDFEARPSVLARRVVLALPRRPLEAVASRSSLLARTDVASIISTVTPHPAAKLFLSYHRPWWRDIGITGRRSVSDLRLSKTYYFDPDPFRPNSGALLLASYSDGPNRDAWHATSGRQDLPLDAEPVDSRGRWERYAAPPEVVAQALGELRELHGVDSVPDPVASAYVDWGPDSFGGAWHVWNVGARSWEVMPAITQPLLGEDVYVCGEPYSCSQGWVEGALESAERVIRRVTSITG